MRTVLSSPVARFSSLLALCGGSLLQVACIEEGHVPDCPQVQDYLEEGQEQDDSWLDSPQFESYRKDSEEAGCLTPVGGNPEGDSGGAGGGT